MKFPGVPIKAVAILMLVLHLFLPALLHAHSMELAGTDQLHSSDTSCLHIDNSHDSPDGDQHETARCPLDAPLYLTHSKLLDDAVIVGMLASQFNYRLLPGYLNPIYIPPKRPA